MKTALASLLALLLLGCATTPGHVADPQEGPSTYASRFGTVRLTPEGPRPAVVVLSGDAGGVAFVNDTRSDVFAIRFTGNQPDAESAYARDFETVGRVTFTPAPLGPGEVASVYLRGPGRYNFEVCESGRGAYRGELRLVAAARWRP